MKAIDLIEETFTELSREELPDNIIDDLRRSKKFEIELVQSGNSFAYKIKPRGWVGYLPLSNSLLVRISPKLPVQNLFQMLEVAYQLKSFRFSVGQIAVEHLEDAIEYLASVLARRVLDRGRVGFFRTYLDEEDDLLCVRGQIDLQPTINNRLHGFPNIRCRFQENTADIEDNQIILWTLNVISHMGLHREEVRAEVRKAYRALAGTVDLIRHDSSRCVNRIYNRLNDDYQPMHGLCRLFLEHSGPGIRVGDKSFIPFTLRMPELFELFVAEWLKAHSPSSIQISSQYHARIAGDQNRSVKIDLLVRESATKRPVAVLDTKYKIGEEFADEDVNQIVAYATRMGTNLAILVYPRPHQQREAHYGPVTVRSLAADLGDDIEDAMGKFKTALLTTLSNPTSRE